MRLLFLHAFPLNGRMSERELAAFDGVAPDLYRGDTSPEWAAAALDLIDGPFVAFGCSMGASCALEVARLAPDRVTRLVLVGGKAGVRYEPDVRDSYIDTLSRGPDALLDEFADVFFSPHSEVDGVRALMHEQSVDQLVRGVWAFHTRPDASDVLAAFDGPVRIVRGALDGVGRHRPPEPGTIEVPGAGHYVNLDQPAAFATIVDGLLAEIEGRVSVDPLPTP